MQGTGCPWSGWGWGTLGRREGSFLSDPKVSEGKATLTLLKPQGLGAAVPAHQGQWVIQTRRPGSPWSGGRVWATEGSVPCQRFISVGVVGPGGCSGAGGTLGRFPASQRKGALSSWQPHSTLRATKDWGPNTRRASTLSPCSKDGGGRGERGQPPRPAHGPARSEHFLP